MLAGRPRTIHAGPFSDWWQETLLSLEGEDHSRLRRLLMPAFRNKTIAAMAPRFRALANELIDDFAARGEVEFISQFAEPYAARIICLLLGLPEEDWAQIAHWADDLGASFSIDVAQQVPRIEAALTGLHDYLDEVIADRRRSPTDDLISTLVRTSDEDGDRLYRHELGVALVFLAFAGMETTRNQLGLALQTLLRHPDQWRLLGERPDLGANAVEEVMRVNPTVTWVTREALEDVEFQGLHIPPRRHRPDALPRRGHRPRTVPDPSFDITATGLRTRASERACTTVWVTSSPAPTWPSRCRCSRAGCPTHHPMARANWLPVSGNTGAVRFPIRFSTTSRRVGAALRRVPSQRPVERQ